MNLKKIQKKYESTGKDKRLASHLSCKEDQRLLVEQIRICDKKLGLDLEKFSSAIFLLGKYYKKSNNKVLREVLDNAVDRSNWLIRQILISLENGDEVIEGSGMASPWHSSQIPLSVTAADYLKRINDVKNNMVQRKKRKKIEKTISNP